MAELKRTLGLPTIVALTIVSVMGSSIFFGVSIAAGISGVKSLVAWALIGLMAIYVSACFGELISIFPGSGGVYEFAKQTYGRFTSFIIGWTTWIVGNITTALMIVAAIDYAMPGSEQMLLKLVITIGIIILLNLVTYFGIEASSKILIVFAAITLLVVISIVVPGLGHVEPGNLVLSKDISYLVILFTVFYIVEAFFGWESASFMAEETKNAQRVIPRGLLIATIASVFLGFLVAFVQIGSLGVDKLVNSTASFLDMASLMYGDVGVTIINIGIIITLVGAASGGIVGNPRLLLSLAKDKLFIEQFSHISKRFRTPDRAILIQTMLSIVFVVISFGRYQQMLSYLVPLALLMYVAVLMSVTILRFKKPEVKRYFKAPLGKIIPIVISLVYIGIVVIWAKQEASGLGNLKVLGSFLLLAFPIYLLLTFYYNPSSVIRFHNWSSFLSLWFEDILLPKSMRKNILRVFHNLKDMRVLEFGSGVGTLTMHLAEAVGPKGEVLAVDLSKKNLNVLEKRLKKSNFKHIRLLHDEHMINRIHPDITRVDAALSVGHLTYIQDMKKVLHELYDVLPDNGRICFVEYVDFFWLLPDRTILGDEEALKAIFREAGFSVNIIYYGGLLWKFIFIYGLKTGDEEVPVL